MKLTTRKDKPCEPIISTSECWAGLQLVRHILSRIVESGDAPEQVVERSLEFRQYLETLMHERNVFPNCEDRASLEAVISAGSLPTLRSGPTRRRGFSVDIVPKWSSDRNKSESEKNPHAMGRAATVARRRAAKRGPRRRTRPRSSK